MIHEMISEWFADWWLDLSTVNWLIAGPMIIVCAVVLVIVFLKRVQIK